MKLAIIINSRSKNKLPLFLQTTELSNKKLFEKIDFFETKHAGHAVELAENAARNGYRYIIAAGGDGTINEVVNGVMKSGLEEQCILGHFTAGTANDLSKTIGITGKYEQLFDLIEYRKVKKIDIGEVSYIDPDGKNGSRYFVNIADMGLGGVVVDRINKNSSKILSPKFTFLKEITKTYLTYKKTELECETEGYYWRGKVLSMAIANGKYLGSGLCIAPDARIDDGKFSLVILGDIGFMDYLTKIGRIRKGETFDHPEVFYQTIRDLKVNHIDTPTAIDMDGEFVGYTPAQIKILPARVNFLMP